MVVTAAEAAAAQPPPGLGRVEAGCDMMQTGESQGRPIGGGPSEGKELGRATLAREGFEMAVPSP